MSTKIELMLAQILARLERVEAAVAGPSEKVAKTSAEAVLREKLDRLTIKRHAVLTASLGDVSYQEIAKLMECDITTVKLHLKAALNILGIQTRSILLADHKKILDSIADKEYQARYGINKRWWLEKNDDLMSVLTSTKPTANQYVRSDK